MYFSFHFKLLVSSISLNDHWNLELVISKTSKFYRTTHKIVRRNSVNLKKLQ